MKKWITFIVILAFIYFADLSTHIDVGKDAHSVFDYWNVVWTCVGAFAVPVSFWTFWKETQRDSLEKENKKKQEDRKRREELLDRNVPHFVSLYDQYEELSKDKNECVSKVDAEMRHLEAMEEAKYLLHSFKRFYEADTITQLDTQDEVGAYIYLVVSKLENERNYFADNDQIALAVIDNVSAVAIDSNSSNDEKPSTESEAMKTDENKQIFSIGLNNEEAKDKSDFIFFNRILLVRTVSSSPWPEFYGNWKISPQRAKNIDYVIGVEGNVNSNKIYKGIIKVNDEDGYKIHEEQDNRVEFLGKKIDGNSDSSKNDEEELKNFKKALINSLKNNGLNLNSETHPDIKISEIIEEIITPWQGINPTVYFGHLVFKYKEYLESSKENN